MQDRYRDFAALAAGEVEGVDYRIVIADRGTALLVMAPHGGKIEAGTSQIAAAVAGGDWSFYALEGMKPTGNRDLHITSDRFDEPRALAMAAGAERVLAVHGRKDQQPSGIDAITTWVGGLDAGRAQAVVAALRGAGFAATIATATMTGRDPRNICNRGRCRAGVQLEIPMGERDRLLREAALLAGYAAAVREGSA